VSSRSENSGKEKISFGDERFLLALEVIDKAETLKELLDSLPPLIPNMVATYHHFGAVGAFDYKDHSEFHAYNVPPDLLNYLNNHRRRDSNPAVVAVFAKGDVVWLSELIHDPYIIEVGHDRLTQATIDLTGDALCLPLYGPNSRSGYLFLAFGFGKAECDAFLKYRMQNVAQKFHNKYCLMLNAMHMQINLTPREAEVLELITFGKTNTMIGDILGISTSTVSGYVKQIFLKLDVTDRVSAAMRAQTLKVKI
jgi:LuxR family transcriptional regulator/LuxR family quorum-sensing system transcriptional regulator CciR